MRRASTDDVMVRLRLSHIHIPGLEPELAELQRIVSPTPSLAKHNAMRNYVQIAYLRLLAKFSANKLSMHRGFALLIVLHIL